MNKPMNESLAKLECQQLIARSTYHMDVGEYDEFGLCYKEDAVLIHPLHPDNPITGRDAIVSLIKSRPKSTAVHFPGNSVITILGENNATGISRVFLLKGPSSDHFPVKSNGGLKAGTYYDRYEKIEDTWYIAERRGVIEIVQE